MDRANLGYGGLYERLRKELGNMYLVDAHEHLPGEEQWLAQEADFTSLLGYAFDDMVSAGMQKPEATLLAGMRPEEKWNWIRPFWKYVRNMGAGSLCRRALSMFFDVDDLNDSTIPIIQEKLNGRMKPGIYRRLLQDKHNIAVCVNVVPVTGIDSSEVFAPILYTSDFAAIQSRNDIHILEKTSNQEIYSLETYLRALDSVLEKGLRSGLVGIKWHRLAYLRDIHYPIEGANIAENTVILTRTPLGAGPYRETLADLPLRVLLVLSEPRGFKPIAPENQARQLSYGLRDLAAEGAVVIDELRPPTYDALIEAVRGDGHHVLHFYGHGAYRKGAGHLIFEKVDGGPDIVRADDLGAVMNNSDVRLVVMGACIRAYDTRLQRRRSYSVMTLAELRHKAKGENHDQRRRQGTA